MISVEQKGSYVKTYDYLKKLKGIKFDFILKKYAKKGVDALSAATPFDTGLTSKSWSYEIEKTATTTTIKFNNSNIQNGIPIAIILQYGHGTRNGGYVEGIDYINPALRPVFDKIVDATWKEVQHL